MTTLIETVQMYVTELDRTRTQILTQSIPACAGNRVALQALGKWAENITMDITVINSLLYHIESLEK